MLQIDKCWLTTDARQRDPQPRARLGARGEAAAYDQETHEGYLRHLLVREGRNTGQALVQLVTSRGERFDRERLIEVLTAIPEVKSIHWSVNEGVAEVTNLPTELLWGEDAIEEEIGGLRFRVRPNAFLQTNTEMAEQLYAIAREFAGLTGGETVYDLYCGIGTIGLSMAAHAMTVWGIEISEESVACAIENQELNAIGNTAFFAGNVGEVLNDLRQRAGDPDVVVVDPPRAGLAGKALKRLGEIGAPRIVYVSCNPTTLAGDASGSPRTTATASCARVPSTCSRTRRTSSASRCSSAHVRQCCSNVDDVRLQGVRHAVPAERRAAGRVPDLRGPAAVHPARRGPGLADVGGVARAHEPEIRDDHGILGIGCTPSFAIGQRALLVKSGAGNVLWDCIAYLDDGDRGARSPPRAGSRRSRSRTRTTTPRWSSGRTRSAARSTCTRPSGSG